MNKTYKFSKSIVGITGGLILLSVVITDPYYLQIITWLAINFVLAASLRFMMLTGEISLVHAGFMGIGAYTSGALSLAGYSLGLTIPAGLILSGIVAALFGLISLRLRGAYFLLVTFAFSEILRLFFTNYFSEILGGATGLVVPGLGSMATLYIVIVSAVVLWVLHYIEQSRLGSVLKCLHQNMDLTESIGYNQFYYKLAAFCISSSLAGLIGALFAHYNLVIAPQDFTFVLSIYVVAYVIIGGKGKLEGALLGAALLTLLSEFIRQFGALESLAYGLILVLTMLISPDGLLEGIGRIPAMFKRKANIDIGGKVDA
ncbi:branched-chain amino acid ABC transporter permease [Metallumcola ferriviriculae]|uniref:Branched-chain amino acid ABC transporter permease n=1 Tax=Metallumcola ferriviriculae TaxID=3039180 RepID=A0AAU0ULZ9_9FIRM|nr:branched-chain amino acid ABC transporter permease [Desulfitibacteraceae bacterium MK1]